MRGGGHSSEVCRCVMTAGGGEVMGLRGWWAARVELRRKRAGRVRVTWRNCDGCRRYGYQTGSSGLCERCLSWRQQTP